jgi:aminoglycoside/choline kinase family phosphotransferase
LNDFVDRDRLIQRFLRDAGWSDALRAPLAGDASSRRYYRLRRGAEPAVLMDAPPAAESAPCPPEASEEQRCRLGYNAMARLAGPNVRAFAALAGHLRDIGLSAPRVLAADFENGLLLLEDLGDDLYSRAVAATPEAELYVAAIEALARLHSRPAPAEIAGHRLLAYDRTAALAETGLFLDWYAARSGKVSDRAREEWNLAWDAALTRAQPAQKVIVLRDYHADNLLWLPDRSGAARAGLLDFQDALAGHPAYDFVSLVEDARRDVDPQLANALIGTYLDLTGAAQDPFVEGMAVWAGQRNAKILGIFVRLATRDGKMRYLDFLPRVERLFANDISHSALEGVRDWVGRHSPSLLKAAA